jgi:hypothetical protein
MRSNNRKARGVGMAVGAAFAAALIGLANAPAAQADADLNPFEDLFGNTGFNFWTTAADASLPATLAGSLDTSVDNFWAAAITSPNFPDGTEQFTYLLWSVDPSAFTPGACGCFPPVVDPAVLPDTNIADFAVGLDYTLFATGIAGNEVGLSDLLGAIESIPAYIVGVPVLLALLFA